ncbi:MAG: hypothetical protein ACUVUC_13835 [Thermoguttaceae bacterium]
MRKPLIAAVRLGSRELLLPILAILAQAILSAGPAPAAPGPDTPVLQAGFGQTDITPTVGGPKPVYLAGFGQNRKATGILDPLKARAVVFKHGKRKLALVCVDLVGLFYAEVLQVRRELEGFDLVVVASTHNHEGPDTLGLWGKSPLHSGVDPEYLRTVRQRIVEAVKTADQQAAPAEARIATSRAPELLRDTREPYVKHDELVVLTLWPPGSDKPSGMIVQWNCHPEVLASKNTRISSDFVGPLVERLQARYGCPAVHFTGAVGGLMTTLGLEIRDAQGQALADGTVQKTHRYAELVAEAVEKAMAQSRPIRLTPMLARSRELFIPIDNALYLVARTAGVLKRDAFVWEGNPYKASPFSGTTAKSPRLCIRTEVGWLRLGELDVALIPGEIYPELVLGKVQDPPDPGSDFPDCPIEPAIYGQLAGPFRMIVGLANDEIGYIIPKRQWDQKPPFCYGRKTAQYGEINSVGPEAAPIVCEAFRALVQ